MAGKVSVGSLVVICALAASAAFLAPPGAAAESAGAVALDSSAPAPGVLPAPPEVTISWEEALRSAERTGVTLMPLSLADAIVMSLRNNLDIRVAGYNPLISLAGVQQALSEFDPVLSAAFNYASLRPQAVETTTTTVEIIGNVPQTVTVVAPSRTNSTIYGYQAGIGVRTTAGGTLTLDTRTSRNKAATEQFFGAPFRSRQDYYDTDLTLAATQPLLRGAGVFYNKTNILIAQNNARVSSLAFANQVMDLILSVDRAYWILVYSLGDLKAKEISLAAAEDFLRTTTSRVEGGVLAPIEVSRARARVADRQEEIVRARAATREAEDQLRLVLDSKEYPLLTNTAIFPTDYPGVHTTEFDLENAVNTALALRPDLRQQIVNLESLGILVARAKNQLLPVLDLRATYALNGIGDDWFEGYTEFSGEFRDITAGLNFAVPLGNRAARSAVSAARYQRAQGVAQLAASERNVRYLVKRAIRDVRTAVQSIDTNRVRVQAAEEQLEAERRNYEAGASIALDVLDAQDALQAARSSYIFALAGFNTAMANYYRQTGTILQRYGVAVSAPAVVRLAGEEVLFP